jgi:hypothetical protein
MEGEGGHSYFYVVFLTASLGNQHINPQFSLGRLEGMFLKDPMLLDE